MLGSQLQLHASPSETWWVLENGEEEVVALRRLYLDSPGAMEGTTEVQGQGK